MVFENQGVLIGLAAFVGSGIISVIIFRISNKILRKKLDEIEQKETELRSYIDLIIKARTRDNKEILDRLEKLQERIETIEMPEGGLKALQKEKVRAWRSR